LVAGFPLPFHRTVDYRPQNGAVVATDLEPDGKADLVVSIPTGIVTVIGANGAVRAGWPRTFDSLPQPAYPVGAPGVGDLQGDGSIEIVVCVVSGTNSRKNYLYAFTADGRDLPGWPVELSSQGDGYYSCSPAGVLLADIAGDKRPEILRGMNQDEVQAYSANGKPCPGWPVRLSPDALGNVRGINSELAAADLDGDGHSEVIFVESGLEPRLVAVAGTGQVMPGFPRILPEVVDRQAPVAADLDGDHLPELVQATLPFSGNFLESTLLDLSATAPTVPERPAELHVMGVDGSPKPGWPRDMASGGPWGSVLADLRGDKRLEIVQQDGDLLYAYDAMGQVLSGFPNPLHRDFLRSDSMTDSPWVVGDLDGDGAPDLLQTRSDFYAGSSYMRVFGQRQGGQPVRGFPFDMAGFSAASNPVLVDLTGDHQTDLVLLAIDGNGGGYSLIAWDLGAFARGQGF